MAKPVPQTLIHDLFDPSRDIYRTIEKVITYGAAQEARLKAEIPEYIVTESIERSFFRLLSRMQDAMDAGGENEVGVWVSGFYGSGKSSFTKYFGLAFDERVTIDGVPFLKHLQNRLNDSRTKALLAAVAQRFPAAVVLLDLASEMVAGATMEDVSTVLYYKVLQWAGYSRNLKVAALERRLRKDGRDAEFQQRIRAAVNLDWREVQNDPLVVDTLVPGIAHEMYPALFTTPTAFSTDTHEYVQFENERVKEMIDIIREATGRQYIIFVIDEVGQYVGSRQNLILNLDGLAKNVKQIGEGKVWIIGTAQQTLTEDDPRSAINSPQLYKLKDRFPVQVDLESSDIREICTRRLLGKSTQGEAVLAKLFTQHGQGLRQNAKLQDAKYYDSDFDQKTFADLYPFLPAHFDILLHLLGALAKSTGGVGLRSAIKVIQDILVERADGQPPVAERPVGWIATTVTLYDALEKDIRRAYAALHRAVEKARIRFPDSALHHDVAKTVAVLQILGNLPVSRQNVAGLMHPAVDAPSRREEVDRAVAELIRDSMVPFGEQDGNLRFYSERLNTIDQERGQIPLRQVETRRIHNEALREVFTPLPSTQLQGNRAVTAGVKCQAGSLVASLAGERETIQTVVEFAEAPDYETARSRLLDESRQHSSRYTVYLLARTAPDVDDRLAEIYRCREVCSRYRNEPDQEVKEYCAAQADQAAKLDLELQQTLRRCLSRGSFIFRGQATAVDNLDQELAEACRKQLADVAAQVFDRYAEAPVRAETALAERFLRVGNLAAITADIDPLGLVKVVGGRPQVRPDHKAMVSIRDFLDQNGTVEGRVLLEHFANAPFGWSNDTLRYLAAALLVAGEIRLKVAGREVTVNGQQAIEALRTNNAFKAVGIGLRAERPSLELLARAADRLTELVGEQVLPLEPEISKAATRYLPRFQTRAAALEGTLSALGLPGTERTRSLSQAIADLLAADASDAPQRFGAEQSALFEDLKWAVDVERALGQGLKDTMQALQEYRRAIDGLPASGVPGELRTELAEDLGQLQDRLASEDFHRHAADLSTLLTQFESRTCSAAKRMADAQKALVRSAEGDLRRLPEWAELTQQEQSSELGKIEGLGGEAAADLNGLRQLVRQEFDIHGRLSEMKQGIVRRGQERCRQRLQDEKEQAVADGRTGIARELRLPATITSAAELDALIGQLQEIRQALTLYNDIEVTIRIQDSKPYGV
jgi:hypothetical protein